MARLVWLKEGLTQPANDDSYTDDKPKSPIQVFHYHNDHLGTPNELTNQEGEVIWLADYEAYGNTAKIIWREERLESLQVSADELQPIRFQGQSFDTETGLHYNRFRYFDPDLGMFTTRDPIGLLGGMNVFQYAPNPIVWIDPFGLSNYLFRADDGYKLGNDIGLELGSNADLMTPQDHVNRGKNQTSIYTSFSERMSATTKFGKNKIKIAKEALEKLAQEGVIKILTPDDVGEMMKNSGDKKTRRDANNVVQAMKKNFEILIEGKIPSEHVEKCN